jgi:4-hydroxythreonine-4-phosphate dehydrogenase
LLPIALSCGDPAGIGAEVALKARAMLGADLPFFWIGEPAHLPVGAVFSVIEDPGQAASVPAAYLPVLAHSFPQPATPGQPGQASAICTLPINKKVLKDGAGFAFPGHTEYLAHLGGVSRVVMMLACPELRVVPATIHIALADVPRVLTPDLLEDTIRITDAGLRRDFGIARPRIAVAGLNPHAGEGGAMGWEETQWIGPLIARMAAEGFDLRGPMPPDTMFHKAARARYDVAVCMYHDQALIPIKTVDFDGGVNVTLGLPFIRTSPDHGTAYDIAGKGIASATSLVAALRMAQQMAAARGA